MLMTKKIVDEELYISEIKYIEYDPNDLQEYQDEFNTLKEIGVIVGEETFESDHWCVKTGNNSITVSYSITELEYLRARKGGIITLNREELISAFKAYCLILLRRTINETARGVIVAIKNLLLETNGFDPLNAYKVPESENFLRYAEMFDNIQNFFNFIGVELDLEYLDQMEIMAGKVSEENAEKSNRRQLSLFSAAFMLDDYMQQAIKDLSDEEFEKYFPTILWWKLSTIIPLRSSEIVATTKDCLISVNGKYKIKLSRSSLKGKGRRNMTTSFRHTFKDCYHLQEVSISAEVAELIQRYNEIVDKFDVDRFYLFSYKSYLKYWPLTSRSRLSGNKDSFIYSNYILNINYFYEEILHQKYGLNIVEGKSTQPLKAGEIQKFNPMDTRHFAIINMVLMGFEPMSIKEITGHESVLSSYHYYNHVDEYVQCYVVSMAKRESLKNNVAEDFLVLNEDYSSLDNEAITKYAKRLAIINKEYKVVDGGYCKYAQNNYKPCFAVDGEHKRCKYFIPNKKNVLALVDELNKIDKEISASIKVLQELVENQKTVADFSNKYTFEINAIRNNASNKAKILANYISTSVIKQKAK